MIIESSNIGSSSNTNTIVNTKTTIEAENPIKDNIKNEGNIKNEDTNRQKVDENLSNMNSIVHKPIEQKDVVNFQKTLTSLQETVAHSHAIDDHKDDEKHRKKKQTEDHFYADCNITPSMMNTFETAAQFALFVICKAAAKNDILAVQRYIDMLSLMFGYYYLFPAITPTQMMHILRYRSEHEYMKPYIFPISDRTFNALFDMLPNMYSLYYPKIHKIRIQCIEHIDRLSYLQKELAEIESTNCNPQAQSRKLDLIYQPHSIKKITINTQQRKKYIRNLRKQLRHSDINEYRCNLINNIVEPNLYIIKNIRSNVSAYE